MPTFLEFALWPGVAFGGGRLFWSQSKYVLFNLFEFTIFR
jgi:hypothetical protein